LISFVPRVTRVNGTSVGFPSAKSKAPPSRLGPLNIAPMAIDAAAAFQNVTLVGQNKTAVVVGGTLGIGGGVARLLAKLGCSRIIILGRNETRGKAMLEVMKNLAPKDSKIVVEFVKGDLSYVFSEELDL
jgi:threonine dehydrogenase-like Zn-dependent dehydrogenase